MLHGVRKLQCAYVKDNHAEGLLDMIKGYTYPQNTKPFTEVPSTKEINLIVMVENYNGILCAILHVIFAISIKNTFSA